jgi:hypothetical protein
LVVSRPSDEIHLGLRRCSGSANYTRRDYRSKNQIARARHPYTAKAQHFAVLYFFASEILRAVEASKEELKLMIRGQKANETA